jgi:signal transduction histidine kinase
VPYIGRYRSLGAVEGPGDVRALVLLSQRGHRQFLSQLRWQLAGTGLAAILAATVIGYLVARTVTRPLRALARTMREMTVTGDLSKGIPALGPWDDEDARVLATTFRQLTTALDRFQREASLRERLSSLGRLSAVIAHEIRNPLMIIKSTVRGLRHHRSPEVIELAASIDEEVARVNRVVTGVLDFARPIALDPAPARLDEIASAAVQAVQRTADDVPVRFEDGTGRAQLVTDADHVRTVFINLLTNAQQAVRSVSHGAAPPPVVLRTSCRAHGGWRIDVVDQGPGIAPGDQIRIFDPFYTTRRTGSGLGLAIARNIIEALGGTITIDSRVGSGTTVRVDLPDAAPVAGETR